MAKTVTQQFVYSKAENSVFPSSFGTLDPVFRFKYVIKEHRKKHTFLFRFGYFAFDESKKHNSGLETTVLNETYVSSYTRPHTHASGFLYTHANTYTQTMRRWLLQFICMCRTYTVLILSHSYNVSVYLAEGDQHQFCYSLTHLHTHMHAQIVFQYKNQPKQTNTFTITMLLQKTKQKHQNTYNAVTKKEEKTKEKNEIQITKRC